MIGEFANEAYAEQVAEALSARTKPKQYAIVQRSFDFDVKVGYADYMEVALEMKKELEALYECEFRIYERELTDPVAIARVSLQTGEQALADHIASRTSGACTEHKPD
jgi:hypothetical protein